MNHQSKQVVFSNRVCLLTINGKRWIGDSTWVADPDLCAVALGLATALEQSFLHASWRGLADGWYLLAGDRFVWQRAPEPQAVGAIRGMLTAPRNDVTGVDIHDDVQVRIGPYTEAVFAAHTNGPTGHGRWTLLEALNGYPPPGVDAIETDERFHLHVIHALLRFPGGVMHPSTATLGTWRTEPAWLIAGINLPELETAA